MSWQGCQRCVSTGFTVSRRSKKRNTPCTVCGSLGITPYDAAKLFRNRLKPGYHAVIVGGGIAGAALALALQHRGVSCSIYEKDEAFHVRAQGYGLTMQQAATTLKRLGFRDLKQFGIASESHSSFTPDGSLLSQYGRMVHSTTKATGCNGRGDSQRFNIQLPRQKLREMLLNALQPGTVNWGCSFASYSEDVSSVKARFERKEGGSFEVVGDLLIGADGIWSRVRQQLFGLESPRYLGLIVILGRAPCSHPLAVKKVFQTLGGEVRIYTMPFTDGVTMWQLSFPLTLEESRKLSSSGSKALLDESIRRCGSWHAPINDILSNTAPEDVTGYPVYDRPPPTFDSEYHSEQVVLIGDSSHPMSPFKGQGANQALIDGLELARKIVLCGGEPVKPFVKEMVERVTPKVVKSAAAAVDLHTEQGLDIRASKLVT